MIRKFKPTDLEAVAKIWLETNRSAHPFVPAKYWEGHLEMVKGMFLQADLAIYEEDGEIWGFLGMDGDYIAGLFIRAEAQSRGAGKALLDSAKQRHAALCLDVYEKNERAVRFYQREGFQIQHAGTDPDTGETEYRMVLGR